MMVVFVATAIHQGPDWGDGRRTASSPRFSDSKLYLYFVVGVFAAALMPYEVHFYSSGAIEEGGTAKNLKENRLNAIVGYGLGGVLACALVVVSGYLFHPLGRRPGRPRHRRAARAGAFGETGLLLALGGMLFCVGGAAIDSSFAASYNLAQFLGWEWGRYRGPKKAPRFTASWLVFLLLGMLIVLSGINPVEITEYSRRLRGRRAAAHLPADPADRRRPLVHGRARQRPLLALLGWLYFARDRRPGDRRDPAAADDERRRRMRREGGSSSPIVCSTSRSSTPGPALRPGRRHRAAAAARRGSRRSSSARASIRGGCPAAAGAGAALAGPERWGSNAMRVPWEEVDGID